MKGVREKERGKMRKRMRREEIRFMGKEGKRENKGENMSTIYSVKENKCARI